jgi:lysophospholipase L1-like esterase
LDVSPAAVLTPATLTVTVDATGLSAGTYTGTITAEADADGFLPATLSVTLNVIDPNPSVYSLMLSGSSNRANPVLLEGQSVTGDIYVFISPESGISRVSFYLDDPGMTGSPQQVEGMVPYDFAGTFSSGLARPYDSSQLSDGFHEITAFIELTAGGSETVSAQFSREMFLGDYYVAFGDSITAGYGDDIISDDISLDLRNAGGGYEPILNDLLTAAKGYSHTVVNQGIGGEESIDGRARIQNVIDAHPLADYFLILFGTNDSAGSMPVISGWHVEEERLLEPGESGYAGSFLDNMQRIINAILAAGKEPILAKVPITLGPCSSCERFPGDPDTAGRNSVIKEYNLVIQGLKKNVSNNITVQPPDFYALFNEDVPGGKRYDFEYFDNLHPNGTGYQSMAALWLDALTN